MWCIIVIMHDCRIQPEGQERMKINIYYGGRGLIEDPTLYVINKIQDVLKEIRVTVGRYNLYEQKNGISMLRRIIQKSR